MTQCGLMVLQVDRMCLNCHRVEQTECECPCECLLLADLCTDNLSSRSVEIYHHSAYEQSYPVSSLVSTGMGDCIIDYDGKVVHSSCVRRSMLHGSETWPVRKENVVALQRAEM